MPGQPPGTAPALTRGEEMKVEVADRDTTLGLVGELLTISSDPLADGNCAASSYSTDTPHDPPTASVVPLHVSRGAVGVAHGVVKLPFTKIETHRLPITNPPAELTILAAEMLSGAVPVFVSVTVCGLLSIVD